MAILDYLKKNVLEEGWSVLDLGAAAGGMLRGVMDLYMEDEKLKGSPRGKFYGVELVSGWVDFAKEYFVDHPTYGHVGFAQGDITNFSLENNQKFDFVMMNDVMEHLQSNRYGCFFEKIKTVTKEGSIVYMHTPTPDAQLHETGQFYENVLPHHIVVAGMADAGFELLTFEHDLTTFCDIKHLPKFSTPRMIRGTQCWGPGGGWTKYYHVVFVKREQKDLYKVSAVSSEHKSNETNTF